MTVKSIDDMIGDIIRREGESEVAMRLAMKKSTARAFIFGIVSHGGSIPVPKEHLDEMMTESDREKIRRLFGDEASDSPK